MAVSYVRCPRHIEQMVQQMQSAVSAGVMEMDRFADQVRRGVKDVAEIVAEQIAG